MKKYLILYYSKTGNSRFIAGKLSIALGCDLKEIKPSIKNLPALFLLSLIKTGIPTNISTKELESYEEIIIVGPVWGGLLISPLRNTLKKCIKSSKIIHFAVTCETKEEDKDNKYGYAKVLRAAEDLAGKFIRTTTAFSTSLVNTDHKSWSPRLSEKIKFTAENFNEQIISRLKNFELKIRSGNNP